MEDREIRSALDRHWAASDANDFEGSTRFIERTRCWNIRNRASTSAGGGRLSSRAAQPNQKRFTVRRIIGAGDLWKVARETQYFGDPFEPGPSRAQWVQRMP